MKKIPDGEMVDMWAYLSYSVIEGDQLRTDHFSIRSVKSGGKLNVYLISGETEKVIPPPP